MVVRRESQFLRAVERNKRIKKMRNMLQFGVYAVDTGKYIKEIEMLHETRSWRAYAVKEVLQSAQKALVTANMQNSSYRSRGVAIKMHCFKISALLDEHLGKAHSYLETKYSDMLRAEHSTIKGRDQAIRFVLEDFYTLRHKLNTVMKLADMLIEDLDSTGWSIKHTADAIAMAFQRERNI